MTYFLNKFTDQMWRDENIEIFISINGAFGGSPKVLRALLSGYNPEGFAFLKHWDIPREEIVALTRTLGSLYTLVPRDQVGELIK